LGKFFYRLDAGDTAALYDMIFYEKNTIRYNGLSNKSEIVGKLTRKFTSNIQISKIEYQEQSSFLSIVASVPFSSDIFFRIAHDWAEAKNSDILQENLYHRIISRLNNTDSAISLISLESRLELLNYLKENYPEGNEQRDLFVIPYPQSLQHIINEIRYKIQVHQPGLGSNPINVDPIIQLEFKQDRGILILNNTCNISYYSPHDHNNSDLHNSEQVLKKIFNMFILIPFIADKEFNKNLKGQVYYRGYKVHTINLISDHQWSNFWQVLRMEGSLYFYPTKIDDLGNEMIIGGLIYIHRNKRMDFYHFGELTINIPMDKNGMELSMKLDFYPYINRANVLDFNGSIKRP
jgi:hypothetical protein